MTWNDREIDVRMGRLLQAGVIAAAAMMCIGGFIYLFVTPEPLPDYSHFHSTVDSFRSIPKIIRDACHGHSAAIIQLGTLLMIATPVARVAFAAYAFAKEHDRMYVVISCVVLALLLAGLLFGT